MCFFSLFSNIYYTLKLKMKILTFWLIEIVCMAEILNRKLLKKVKQMRSNTLSRLLRIVFENCVYFVQWIIILCLGFCLALNNKVAWTVHQTLPHMRYTTHISHILLHRQNHCSKLLKSSYVFVYTLLLLWMRDTRIKTGYWFCAHAKFYYMPKKKWFRPKCHFYPKCHFHPTQTMNDAHTFLCARIISWKQNGDFNALNLFWMGCTTHSVYFTFIFFFFVSWYVISLKPTNNAKKKCKQLPPTIHIGRLAHNDCKIFKFSPFNV